MAFTWNPDSIHFVPIVNGVTGLTEDYVFGSASCDSADTKPTEKVYNGSTVMENDTGDVYKFSMGSKQWNQI